MDEKLNLLEALAGIDPSQLNYQEWVNVGMALKLEGYTADIWDSWSARDPARYHSGECAKKWRSFGNNGGDNVTGGTIVQYAMEQGWSPVGEGHELSWDDDIGAGKTARKDELKVVDQAWLEMQDVPPPPKVFDGAKQLTQYLSLLFDSSEIVGYVTSSYVNEDGRHVPSKGAYDRTAGELIQLLSSCKGDLGSVIGDYSEDAGAWIRFNPLDGKGVKNDNVTEYRYALVESDTLNLSKQYSLMRELQLPIAAMVHSGGKSIHAIVRIDAKSYDEYRQRVDYLYAVCQKNGMQIDRQNRNPSRLSRMPGVIRKGKPQYIIAENIGCESFVAWKEYIESVNDNLPDTENLQEALNNLPPLATELIHGVLRNGHKMLVSGPSKAGKSFGLIELCIAIAEGGEWMGFQCSQGRVLYVNLELDRASCLHRFGDVYKALQLTPEHSSSIDIWNLRGKSVPMDQLAPKLIRRAQKKSYAAIIIDPIYKVITGDENSADQMAQFCNQFDKICSDIGCAVIYCHHHSKGSQGQKRSMDRSSGSGVFGRDPDALLDMIELDIPLQSRQELVNRVIRETCIKWLMMCRPDWEEHVSMDDRCSHVGLQAACASLLSAPTVMALNEELEPLKETASRKTGWRIEGVLREFAPMRPRYVWFEYPVHKEDDTELLRDLTADGEKKARKGDTTGANSARKASAEKRRLSKKEELENAIAMCGVDKPTAKDIAEYMDAKENTVRKWLRDNGYRIDKNTGFVCSSDCIQDGTEC